VSSLREVVPNAYRWVDARLGELVEAAGPEATVIVASDHGFHAETRPDMSDDERSGGHEDPNSNLPGILVVAGPGIRHEDWRTKPPAPLPSVYDVMPTVLEIYGLGAAHDMDGEPCMSLFTSSYREVHSPPTRPTTYEIRPRASESAALPDSAAVDRAKAAAVERLRALGYLGGAAPPKPLPLDGVRSDFDLHDVTIENAIASITLQAGVTIEIDDDAKVACAERKVDLALHQVTARGALEAILGTAPDLACTVEATGVVRVHARKSN
jgi:type I phosphodiesterase/nucleotide pyrophosphatase